VAAIIAESEEIAEKARNLIDIEYENLPVVTDPEEALLPETVILHPDHGSNLFSTQFIQKGDPDKAFLEADVIIEGVYQTPAQEHAFFNTESGVAYYDEEGRVAMQVTGQWAHKDQKQIAHALNLPVDCVRVAYPLVGGAFGGREDIGVQIVLALAVYKLNQMGIKRPVKVVLSREESTLDHCKRHPFKFYTRWAANKNGDILAAEAKMIADGGAYLFTTPVVSSVTILNATGPYDIPNVKLEAFNVYTNAVPRGAMRGFGGPQGAYVAEMQIAKLAQALDMDPVELRMRNIAREGTLMAAGYPFPPGVCMEAVLTECAQMAGWKKTDRGWRRNNQQNIIPGKPHLRRGTGIACSFKNTGFGYGYPEACWITLELFGEGSIEKAVVKHTATEVGQGTYTVIQQMTAEALHVPFDRVEVAHPDTTLSNDSGPVSASRMTFMIGHAIREAAELALEEWRHEERPVKVTHKYVAPATTPGEPETGFCDPMISLSYTAEAVEIEVDMETGQTRLLNVYCANDIGKAINPVQVEGQLQGGLVQSIGYALMENFIEKNGQVLTPNFLLT
jgi:CO/xanthine dehydrogenase Mo-binding subunit